MHRASPDALRLLANDMAFSQRRDRAAIHAFVESIHDHRASYGRLRVDGAVATLAMEYLDPDEVWRAGATDVDTIAFHRESGEAMGILADLITNQFSACAQVRETGIVVCSRERLPANTFAGIAVDVVPAALAEAILTRRGRAFVTFDERGVVFRTAYVLTGWLGQLPRGTYEWTMTLAPEEPIQLEGSDLVVLEVVQGQSVVAQTTAHKGAHEVTLRFDANGDAQPLAYRIRSGPQTPLVITSMPLRRVTAP
jgi:hypothetical protein